jgi:hypothetical protein
MKFNKQLLCIDYQNIMIFSCAKNSLATNTAMPFYVAIKDVRDPSAIAK